MATALLLLFFLKSNRLASNLLLTQASLELVLVCLRLLGLQTHITLPTQLMVAHVLQLNYKTVPGQLGPQTYGLARAVIFFV